MLVIVTALISAVRHIHDDEDDESCGGAVMTDEDFHKMIAEEVRKAVRDGIYGAMRDEDDDDVRS